MHNQVPVQEEIDHKQYVKIDRSFYMAILSTKDNDMTFNNK